MEIRVYAEAMYGSLKWQVVEENLITGEYFIIKRNLPQAEARLIAENLQKIIDEKTKKSQTQK